MGHSFGLPHSSGPYAETYDSDWDPMSDGSVCSPSHAKYGCVGVYTTSYHMDRLLGWIPPARKYTATSGSDGRSVTLKPTNRLKAGKWYYVLLWRASGGITDLADDPLLEEGDYLVSECSLFSSQPRWYPVESGDPALYGRLSHGVGDPLVHVGVEGVGD
jgi:hypothetical protein